KESFAEGIRLMRKENALSVVLDVPDKVYVWKNAISCRTPLQSLGCRKNQSVSQEIPGSAFLYPVFLS
ncbi:unnamed protein product, partial [marine sediment metagenome]